MPRLSETSILDWSKTAASNSPSGATVIGGDGVSKAAPRLADYFRSLKSIYREWSLDKQWVRFGDTPTYVSSSSFSVAGDLTGRYVSYRRVRALVSGAYKLGWITGSSFGSGVTTVTLRMKSGHSLANPISEVQLGILTRGTGSIGTGSFGRMRKRAIVTITTGQSSASINWLRQFPDNSYLVFAQVVSASYDTANPGEVAVFVDEASKTATGITVKTHAAVTSVSGITIEVYGIYNPS